MSKLHSGGLAVGLFLALVVSAPTYAAQGGDSNSGDVWTDNVGQPAGPGHEQDVHLACQDINLWGNGLADATGGFVVDGWPPSGSKESDYSGTWNYDTTQGGDQVIAVINVSQLIATAQANGDSPQSQQGYHFKLQLSQDPHKSKTFWVNCPAGSASTTAQSTAATSAPSSTTSTTSTTTTTTTTTASVKAEKVKRAARRRHRHRRHTRVHRALSHRPLRLSGFTG